MTEQQTTELTNIDLEAGSEWRFELEADENIALRVSPQIQPYDKHYVCTIVFK